jgi:hypothetical protein
LDARKLESSIRLRNRLAAKKNGPKNAITSPSAPDDPSLVRVVLSLTSLSPSLLVTAPQYEVMHRWIKGTLSTANLAMI